MKKTIEQKVGETILQEEFIVTVGAKEYIATPICYGTLIRVSAIISTLPAVSEEDNLFSGALRNGVHADKLAEVVALCLLNRKSMEPLYQRKLLKRTLVKPGLQQLKDEILYNCTIGEVGKLVRLIFSKMELADFFGVMVSLSGVNLIAETKTTVSGQLSEV